MQLVEIIFVSWSLHALVASVLLFPVVFFGRKRVRWSPWELIVLVLPFSVWFALMLSPLSDDRKSLANLGFEPLALGAAVVVGGIIRILLGGRGNQAMIATTLIAALCAVAAITFFAIPGLPE